MLTGPRTGPLVLAHGDARLPELTPARVLDTWTFDPLLLTGLVLAGGLYLYAVARLRARGVPWSTGRCVLWLIGLLIVLLATSSSVGAYDTTLFTMHAVQHMLLQMLAPVPLALRTLPRGGRRALLKVLHSRVSRVLTHPLVAYAIFVVSPFALYYTSLYEATLRNDWLHDMGHVHFILTGFLLFAVLVGVDPLPHRMPYVYRIMMIFGLGPMHVLLGIPVMMGTDIFAESYYLELARDWGPTLLADQQVGGGLLWIFGDVVTVAFLGGIYLQWLRSDAREARRVDRQLDRLYGAGPTMPAPWTVAHAPAVREQELTSGVGEPPSAPRDPGVPSQRAD